MEVQKLSEAGKPENAVCFLRVAFQLLEGSQEYQDVSRLTSKFTVNLCPFLLVPVLIVYLPFMLTLGLSAITEENLALGAFLQEAKLLSLVRLFVSPVALHCICSDLSFLGQG